jgi:hypothetical protein
MAQLPPDGDWLVQLIGREVIVFQRYTEIEVVRYDNSDPDAAARAQKTIHDSELLTDEQKCYAHFWCGYFHSEASRIM